MLHHTADERVTAVRKAVDVDLDSIGQITVNEQRAGARDDEFRRPCQCCRKPLNIAVHLTNVVNDFHRAAAEDVGRTYHHGEADRVGDRPRFGRRSCDARVRLLQAEASDEGLEAVAILRKVNGIG